MIRPEWYPLFLQKRMLCTDQTLSTTQYVLHRDILGWKDQDSSRTNGYPTCINNYRSYCEGSSTNTGDASWRSKQKYLLKKACSSAHHIGFDIFSSRRYFCTQETAVVSDFLYKQRCDNSWSVFICYHRLTRFCVIVKALWYTYWLAITPLTYCIFS